MQREAKKARAVLDSVPAAAQRQALRAVPHPDGAHRVGRVHGIQREQFQKRRGRDAAFRRHGLKGAGRRRRCVRAGVLAGDGLVQLHRARTGAACRVIFQRVRRAGRGQRAVLQNGLPSGGIRAHVRVSRCVVILDNLDFPGVQAQAARPFPHIAHKVRNARRTVVMPPAYRPGAGQRASVQIVVTDTQLTGSGGKRAGLVLGFVVLAPVGVAARLEPRLDAQRTQQRPFRVGHQVPARALVLAVRHRAVEVQRVGRVHTGQAHRVAVHKRRRIHADEKFRLLDAVDDEGRMRPGQAQVGIQVLNPHFRDAAHEAGMPSIVIQYRAQAARGRFHAGTQAVFRDDGRHVMPPCCRLQSKESAARLPCRMRQGERARFP